MKLRDERKGAIGVANPLIKFKFSQLKGREQTLRGLKLFRKLWMSCWGLLLESNGTLLSSTFGDNYIYNTVFLCGLARHWALVKFLYNPKHFWWFQTQKKPGFTAQKWQKWILSTSSHWQDAHLGQGARSDGSASSIRSRSQVHLQCSQC